MSGTMTGNTCTALILDSAVQPASLSKLNSRGSLSVIGGACSFSRAAVTSRSSRGWNSLRRSGSQFRRAGITRYADYTFLISSVTALSTQQLLAYNLTCIQQIHIEHIMHIIYIMQMVHTVQNIICKHVNTKIINGCIISNFTTIMIILHMYIGQFWVITESEGC